MQNPHRWVFLCSLVSLGVAFFAMFPVLLRPLRDRHRPVLWHELIEMDGATAKFATKGFLDVDALAVEMGIPAWDAQKMMELPYVRPEILGDKPIEREIRSRGEYDQYVIARFNDAITVSAEDVREKQIESEDTWLTRIATSCFLMSVGLAVVGWKVRPVRENSFP